MKALVKGAMVVCLVVLFFSSNAQTPDWAAPDPSQFTYSVTAIVAPVLEDTLQRNPGDQLAFFSGQEIRGISFFVFGVHFVELFSNQPLDTFSIHYYNAEEDKVYIASNPFLFFEGSNTGLIYEPVLFFFNRQQSQPLSFSPIPDQLGLINASFFVLDVSDYLFSSEGDSLIWTFEFPSFLNVSVDGTQLLVDPMNEFTGFVILKVRVEDAFNQNRFAETEILYIVLPDREAPQFKVIPGQGIAVGSEFFNVCDETSSVVFDLREFTQPYSSCLQFDYQVPLFPLNPGVSKPNWDNLKGEMDSMIVYAKTQYTPSVLLNSTDNILGVFSNGERVGVSNDANENTEGIFKIILYDLPEGERLTFSLYSAELANLLDSPSEIFYQPGGQVGSPSLPLILDFSPLRPHLTPEGELSIEVLQKEWIGEQSFVFFARDCDFPDHLFSQQTAIFSVVSSEEELQFYYRDEDNNGLGNPLVFTQHSLNPMGYVSNGWDCAEAFPEGNCLDSLTLYLDQDGRSIFSLSEALPLLSQACGLEGISISQDQFECKDLGRKELQLETMDRNGNSLVRNIPLELRDTIAPLLECVQEFVLGSCQEMIPNAMDFVQIEDNCEGWVVSQEPRAGIPFGSLGDSLVLMNIRVEDIGGNVSFCVVTIRVEDYQPPQFLNCPNTTFTVGVGGDCEGGVIWSIPIALDDCGPVVVEETSLGGPYYGTPMSPGIYPLEYTATDFSGNTAVCQFTVIVSDDTEPLLVCLPNIRITSDPQQCSFTSESDELNPLLATDNCPGWTLTYAYSGAVQGQGVGAIPSTEFPLGKTYVEYRLEDINGNSSYCQFFIEVEDTEPPIVTCPANISVANDKGICGAVVDYDLDQAIDNCTVHPEKFASLFTVEQLCGQTSINRYLIKAIDADGNEGFCIGEIRFMDRNAPLVIKEAEDLVVNCSGTLASGEILAWLNSNGNALATETCGEVIWTHDFTEIGKECGGAGEFQVVFTARDACGNSSSTQSRLIVLDEEAPVWERAPQNKVFECRGGEGTSQELAFWLSTQGGGIAKDKCSSVVYSNDFEGLIVHCGEFSGAAWVTFTAIDECGNESKASAMISFEDTEPPVIITQARDTSVQCDGNGNTKDLESWLKTNGGAQAMDLCSPPISWENEQISTFESCEGRKQIRFRFFAQDDCGNISLNTEATFLIEDTTPPQWLQNPLDKEVSCGSSGELQSWLSQFGGALAADDCSTVQYSYDLISNTTLCGLGFESEYRFTATDACGNVSHVTAFFAAYDTLPPTITGGSDFYLEDCGQGPLGEYAALNGWLTQNAGALAIDDCGGIIWSNDYNQDNWVYECGNSGYVDVVFTAQDLCGNRSNFTRRFTVGDNRSPTFLNCPVFPIIVNTPQGWCGAHVNFSMPIATDNCSEVNISQVDTSGLSSGSLFPVGLTVLLFEAEDECGNKSTCTYNIIVNQYSEIGLNCPANISSINDQGMSGARIIGLQSEVASNACEGEIPLIYKIVNEQGEIFDCGINNASGSFFKIGDNTVTYQAQDQALLLITEIVSNSDKVELEITNFGPSAMDLTQLQIERRGLNAASYAVGPNTVLYPGDIYVQEFSAVPPGSQNSYFLSFFGRVMDGIALNGFQPTNFLWSGSLMGSAFARNRICDTDSSEDWDATHNCQPHSLGWINPQLLGNIFAWNGAIATFQSKVPIVKECQFIVTIVDEESPECVDKFRVAYKASAAEKHPGECLRVPVEVEEDFLIAGIRLENIKGHFPDMGGLTIDLIAPGGQSFNLFSNLCPGTEDFDLSFYDNATQFVFEMECEPAGKGQAFIPLQSFSPLLGQSSKGTWSLQMYSHLPFEGLMEQWTLILDLKNSYQQQDTLMANEPGLCGRNFTWMHPFYSDNCCPGSISVEYSNIEKGMLPPSKTLEGLGGQSETQFFPVGTTHVKYTLIDETGNTSYCGFSVTVQNTQFPIINQQLCRDVTLYLEPGQCSTLYSYPSLEEVDVCEAVAIYYDPPLDYRFPIGQTEVVIEVVNSAGNSTLCEFTVTVVEFQPSGNSLVCNSLIRLSLGLDCQAEINADMLLEGSNYRCYDNYCIQLIDALGQPIGNSQEGNAIVNLSHVGTLVQANICSCNSVPVNCCTVMIEVEALSFPIVDCPQDLTLFCNDSLDPQSTGFPKITNCVPSAFIDYYDTYEDLGSCSNPSAQIQRKWLITTDLGDKIECEQIIFIKPLPTSALSFPEDKTGALALNCSEVNMNTAMILPINTGFPTLGESRYWAIIFVNFLYPTQMMFIRISIALALIRF